MRLAFTGLQKIAAQIQKDTLLSSKEIDTLTLSIKAAFESFKKEDIAPSFSEIIIGANEARKTCEECGQLCVIYKERFRSGWLTCLMAMEKYQRCATYKQIASLLATHYGYSDSAANNEARMFILAKHWLVIRQTESKIGRCPIYELTQQGIDVLNNKKAIAEFMWIPSRGVEIDLSFLPQPNFTFANSIQKDNFNYLSSKTKHVEDSISLLP